jgi:hypothetical protein
MASHPLTHHEILGLVEPFTRRGRHADLAASDRVERRLVFKPVDRGSEAPGELALREILELESAHPDTYRLVRRLTLPCGLAADLETEGPDPEALLVRIESIEPRRQFRSGPGYWIAQSHRLEPASGSATWMVLTRGVARVGDVTLELLAPTLRGEPAKVALETTSADAIRLPEDLLAVLGWDWGLLRRVRDGWRSTLKLRGREPERSRDAELRLERTVEHLARTLEERPGQFHDRWAAARWRVAFRRALPLLVFFGVIAGAAASSRLHLADDSPIRMLIFNLPPILMMLVFCMRELPRVELPRFPRRSFAAAWRESVASTGDSTLTRDLRTD